LQQTESEIFHERKFCFLSCSRDRNRRRTLTSNEFHAILKRRMGDALGKLKTLLDNDVARFNQTTGAQVGVSAKP
jgi:hypothetical protein